MSAPAWARGRVGKESRGLGLEVAAGAAPTSARGAEPQEQGCGSVSIGGAELASMFGGRAPGRPGLDRRPRPRGRGDRPRRARDPGGAAPRTGWMRSAFLSPHPSPGGRGRPMTQPPGVRPARAWRSPAPPLPPQPRRPRSGAASRPASLPSPAPSGPSSPRWPLHPFPRHKPGDRYPAWPTARRSGERRGAAETAAPSARLGPARPARLPQPRPRALRSGWHHSPARAHGLGRVAQPTCSVSAAITARPGRGRPRGPGPLCLRPGPPRRC